MEKMLKYPKLVGWNFNLDPRSRETKRTFLLSTNTKSEVLFEFWNSIWNFENNPVTLMGHDIPLKWYSIQKYSINKVRTSFWLIAILIGLVT